MNFIHIPMWFDDDLHNTSQSRIVDRLSINNYIPTIYQLCDVLLFFGNIKFLML